MNRKALPAIFPLMALMVLAGCQAAAPETNRAAPTNNSGPETVDTAAIEKDLLKIENDWPRVLREKDVAAIKRIEADDGVFVYPDGSIGNKAQDLKDIEAGNMTADSIEMLDLKAHVQNKDSAVVTGRTVIKNGKYKLPDGKTIDISGQYRFVDTFSRRNGEWKLVAGASVPIREAAAPEGAKAAQ